MIRRVLALAAGTGVLLLATPAGVAQAHPLGNFTVNHYADVQLSPDRVDVTAVVDRAEIPAAQALQEIAPDGSATPDQLAAAAAPECAALADALSVTVDGERLGWSVDSTALESIPGAAGLPTLRLTCALSADADLSSAATVTVEDDYLTDRVGWREMTADGDGVRLLDAPVPVESITDQLREYPVDLLASPVDVRGFTVRTEPGTNTGAGTSITPGSGDPFSNALAAVDRRLEDLIGGNSLTPLVGTLAILLAVLLGCGHALLPGHGKTVMAAYLAGRDGRPRDALVVGATVTATHTVGVLALGLAISVSSSLAGDQVLRWLGVISGLLVAAIGAAMLRGALPRWRAARRHPAAAATLPAAALPEPALAVGVSAAAAHVHASPHHAHAPAHDHDHLHEHDHLHDHEHGHDHPHDHEHGHDHPHDHEHGHDHPHDHDHEHEHDHAHGADHEHAHEEEHQHAAGGWWSGGHSHGPGGHSHGPGGHSHGPGGHGHGRPIGRGGLIGMGVAAALVPSPSALIVLIASIGLGRTVFGVVLVLAYGLGMAGTLTAVGLLLVRLRGRLARRVAGLRRERPLYRLATAMPVVTAVLVLLVGTSLVLRGVLLG